MSEDNHERCGDQINSEQELEAALEGTSWLEGFRHGREDGFEVGLKLGMMTALKELERLIAKNKVTENQELNLAHKARELEEQLGKLGFIRK